MEQKHIVFTTQTLSEFYQNLNPVNPENPVILSKSSTNKLDAPSPAAHTDAMDLPSAAQLAKALIAEHGLDRKGWTFAFNRRKRALGLCRYDDKRIELSHYFVADNDVAAVRDTVLHEIAHAIAGHKAGHGSDWIIACGKVGATPKATCSKAAMPKGDWQATCPGCGHICSMHRRPMGKRQYSCRKCGPKRGKLRFKHVDDLLAKQR